MLTTESRRSRRAALRAYGLSSDTDLSSLKDVLDVAVAACGVSMGNISLIEESRQLFLVRHNLPFEELPLEETICGNVLKGRDIQIVEDTLLDTRTEGLGICSGSDAIRFYAASPLVTESGRIIGTLTVAHDTPHNIDDNQIQLLKVLSRQVMTHLDLRRALRRAELMRREVDHRVKNSLQSVASLTRLQSRRVTSDEAREALEIVSRRIDTVAALNSELYRIGNDRKVGLANFLGSVVTLIRASAPERVEIDVDVADVNISAAHAGSLAIVVNEFTTNSFKHAFPDDRDGKIVIEGRQISPGQFRLTCRDDGIGLDENDRSGDGLGLSIIDSAVESIHGELTHDSDMPGYAIHIDFSI
ncbi:Blue-light-activated histidine kinase 2 [Rhodobacteraceae bacterium THAF1]|uniref:histidine kinase dimerization/phosphoacceptor domain -containing protein n=1 Tax=Palleronia sp. THAF1 TaxID=2587842 RepID=UPI000F4104DC|nr:histidine kinase dimerization/phosphoacceptor domain -containing protein [Palleronia sp. THAF1]QFU08473.1 Blue-light-activated histidine kinase 2 [Palleronia sp. THAF1]VDC29398.1 Blue-light-activated histidine kinase 2 [Rhodobacteraceae bacterium THAF1]